MPKNAIVSSTAVIRPIVDVYRVWVCRKFRIDTWTRPLMKWIHSRVWVWNKFRIDTWTRPFMKLDLTCFHIHAACDILELNIEFFLFRQLQKVVHINKIGFACIWYIYMLLCMYIVYIYLYVIYNIYIYTRSSTSS